MKKRVFFLIPAFLTLAALAQSEAPSLEETLSTLEEGVTNIPLDAALATISGWRETLEASDDTAVRILGVQLGDLTTALQSEPINTAEVGSLLTTLGKGAVIVGEDRGNDQVMALGDMLTQAGTNLSIDASSGGAASGGGM